MVNSQRRPMGGISGWRGKLGSIYPALYWTTEARHFLHVAPEGVEKIVVTLGITRLQDSQADEALTKVDDAARRLAEIGVDFVVLGGAPLVVNKGHGWDKELIKRIEGIAKVPATHSTTAAVDAFHTLEVNKVVMASPMTHEMDRRLKKFLQDYDIEVIHIKGLDIEANGRWGVLPENTAYNVAREAYLEAPQAQAIYIPCGGWCSPAVIDCLEQDFGKPVIHCHQVSLWAFLKKLNIREPVKGYGRIFETISSTYGVA